MKYDVVVRNIYTDEEMTISFDDYSNAFCHFEMLKFAAKGTETCVDLLDGETGEVLMSLEHEDPTDFEDDVDEVGFNPYLGAYDFDV